MRSGTEHIVDRSKRARFPRLLVDTGSEDTWVPEAVLPKLGVDREKKDLSFVMASGQHVPRSVGLGMDHDLNHV